MMKLLRPPYRLAKKILGLFNYWLAILFQKPYFGSWLMANQCYPPRQAVMDKLIREKLKGKTEFNILEIGAWAGVSTSIWAKALKDAGVEGAVWVVDNWKTTERAPLEMRLATKRDSIYNLFIRNLVAQGLDNVIILRGDSDDVLPFIRKKFDLIYIDGDHAYSQVLKDIENCKSLLKPDGIICGDDLELQAHETDIENTKSLREVDWVEDPATRAYFHPGVTLAVAEGLGKVRSREGFWFNDPD